MMDKAIFFKVFANLPLKTRGEIILVLEEKEYQGPITWNVAFMEINNETKLGDVIFKKLKELGLI